MTLNFATGARHEYSHSDYVLLALVIERVVGVPFGEQDITWSGALGDFSDTLERLGDSAAWRPSTSVRAVRFVRVTTQ